MSTNKASRLLNDLLTVIVELKKHSLQATRGRTQSLDPFERGQAQGYAAGITYSVTKLDELLAGYMSTDELRG
jgi:hypothetical protein